MTERPVKNNIQDGTARTTTNRTYLTNQLRTGIESQQNINKKRVMTYHQKGNKKMSKTKELYKNSITINEDTMTIEIAKGFASKAKRYEKGSAVTLPHITTFCPFNGLHKQTLLAFHLHTSASR